MLKRGIAASFWLIALSGLTSGTAAWAKPADLPGNQQIECAEGDDPPAKRKFSIELDITSKGITLKVGAEPVQPAPAPQIDAVLPAFVDQWLQHAGDALMRPDRIGSLDYLWSKVPYVGAPNVRTGPAASAVVGAVDQQIAQRDNQSRAFFALAEVYRRTGHYVSARDFYQRVHLLAPTSRLGQMAIDRIQEMDERLRDAAEEQGIPGRDEPEARNRDIRNGTLPLGLVRVTY